MSFAKLDQFLNFDLCILKFSLNFEITDVADQLARDASTNLEPNSQNALIESQSQLEPSQIKEKLRKNPAKVLKNPTPPLTPSLKRKTRNLKAKENYPSPAAIRRMEASVKQRSTILIDPPKNPITISQLSESLKSLPRIPKKKTKTPPKTPQKSPQKSPVALSKSGKPLSTKKPLNKPVILKSTSNQKSRSPSPTFSSDEDFEQPSTSKSVLQEKTKKKGNNPKAKPKKRVTFKNLGGGDADIFDDILAEAALSVEMMAPEFQNAYRELIATRYPQEEVIVPEVIEFDESEPIIDEEIIESVEIENSESTNDHSYSSSVTPTAPRSPATGITPEMSRVELNRPLDTNELNRNIATLNSILLSSMGRVVNNSSNINSDNFVSNEKSNSQIQNTSLKNKAKNMKSKNPTLSTPNSQNLSLIHISEPTRPY